jgi:DNA-binding MarR family transcriptional regulator
MSAPPVAADHRPGGGTAAEPGPGGASASEARVLPDELRIWTRMLAAAGKVEQKVAKHVKEGLGVSHDEFLLLCLLAEQPGHTLRMTQIADLLGRPKTRLTYQVACLHRCGLVKRQSVCGDRRGVALTLTDKARRLLAEKSPALGQAVHEAFAELIGPERFEAVAGLLAGPPAEDRSEG